MYERFLSYLRPRVQYEDPLTQQRAEGLITFLAISSILGAIGAIISSISATAITIEDDVFTLRQLIIAVTPFVVAILWYAVREGFYRYASIALVVIATLTVQPFWASSLNTVGIIILALPILLAGALLGWRSVLMTLVVLVSVASGSIFFSQVPDVTFLDFAILVLILTVLATLMIIFSTNIQTSALRYIRELNRVQNVVRESVKTSVATDEEQAELQAINTIRDQLGYTFARIYMVDTDGEVSRRVQTGLNASQVAIDTDVDINTRSGIYAAVRQKEIIRILEDDDATVRQHLLTGTRGALAVPAMDKDGNVLAVLDIQSEDISTFEQTEIDTIALIALQLGNTIEQVRVIENLRGDLAEQDVLISRQRSRLLQYENAERQTTTESWRDYLEQRGVDYMGFDLDKTAHAMVEASNLNEEMQVAIEAEAITITEEGNQQLINVPISLRGYPLGAMSFKVPKGSQIIGARQQELIRNVVQRLSLALENKRLFEQSQSQARRESRANEVGNLLLSSTDIDTVLQLAVTNFNEALGAVQTQIRLKPNAQEAMESENN